ncbi:ATP-binding protein [Weissella oryzae SG25]|uniref:ATP-binding protein n=1 Tax=Weissella oryzae (strain DSM 25784 / JCM 18191 / LMG 30913 / SG25) TaxID=1329250 RepID=A0A069CW81_WEIOS|nr:ATP-binding protein [Weissella oryzae SG25]
MDTTSTDVSQPTVNTNTTNTGSTYDQFINAGGTPALWNSVVMPESGGNPSASNGIYHGLGQTNQGWGYGSVASQTAGMINYAVSRYGSIDAAIAFRAANGWW